MEQDRGKSEVGVKDFLSHTVSQTGAQGQGGGGGGGGRGVLSDKDWSREEVQLLVKAVALHPSGTNKRWVWSRSPPVAMLIFRLCTKGGRSLLDLSRITPRKGGPDLRHPNRC